MIELLVTMSVGVLLIVFLFQLFNASMHAWRQGEDQVETYREARAAMQLMVRDLSQTVQPITASVYPSPAPAAPPVPGATPPAIAPVLVIDQYPNPDPARQSGDEINEEVYCLTTIPNNGASNLCAVGYFCEWKPDFDANSTAPRAYSLMRQYLGSGAPANAAANTAAIPGLYDRFVSAGNTSPLTFLNVYERTRPPQISTTSPPQSTATELASYIWDLQIRLPTSLQSAVPTPSYGATPTYLGATSYANALPAYLEIRFKALSESAARQLEGNASVSRTTWNDASAANDPFYQHFILPGTRQFSARVPIYSGSATSTPSP